MQPDVVSCSSLIRFLDMGPGDLGTELGSLTGLQEKIHPDTVDGRNPAPGMSRSL